MALTDAQKDRLEVLIRNRQALLDQKEKTQAKINTSESIIDEINLLSLEEIYEIWESMRPVDTGSLDDDDNNGYSGGDGD